MTKCVTPALRKNILFLFCFLILQAAWSEEEKHLTNIQQLTFGGENALEEHKPGDSVTVVVLRNSKQISLEAKLERRASPQ